MRTSTERAPVRRTGEIVLAGLGLALSLLFLGGFAGVVNGVDEQAFLRDVHPAMTDAGISVAEADAYEAARTLAAWFGFTLVAVLATAVPGILLARSRPRRRAAGLLFLAAGLVCLLGSQLILYPVAFCFFAAAALFVVRQVPPEEPRERGRARGHAGRATTHQTSSQTSSVAAQSMGVRR